MVRSLLDSSLLTRSSGLRFGLMLLGICVLLGSAPLWLATADFDYNYAFERTVEDPTFRQDTQTSPYRQLTSEEKRTVDAAIDGRSFSFEDDSKDLPKYVSRGGTTYQFTARRAVDWAYPGSFGPILCGIVGLWLTAESIQHERKHLGPRGY